MESVQHDQPVSGNPDTINAGEHVFIKMPSDNVKCIVLKPNSNVSLGKFGTFKANDIIGRAWGNTYEIYDKDNKTRIYHLDEINEVEETKNNNREIIDDSSAQKLTLEDIRALKNEGLKGELTGEEIVNKLKESHSAFDKKTAYSQAKYLQKKGKKFHKIFTPIKPTTYFVNEYFYTKNPVKIRDIRMDTLSQLLSYSNVHSGCKILVVDDTQGMIVSALAERMGGQGTILGLYDGDNPHYDVVKYMNFNQEILDSIKVLSWLRIHRPADEKTPDELQDVTQLSGKDLEGYHRRVKAYKIVEESRQILFESNFDALIVASQYKPESILEKLLQYVRGSRPVIVYHPHKEALLETSTWMRRCPDLLAPQLTESWLRKSQVLPGRTHPEMSTWGSGGSLLSATKIINKPVQAALTKRERLAQEKRNAEAKKLKRTHGETEKAETVVITELITTTTTTTTTVSTQDSVGPPSAVPVVLEGDKETEDERLVKRVKQE
ncbi:tRNA (adenine(58)-N(1))-methyltransferase non-catalytic subunit trm6 [Lobosporangium transversale]|uniref:tRNA (adenine(58)-N(1))-methyltransferase non-catalytic subunit TRM6 n=1 Tax=Lobosporangium transversale TaxID=64571 RepID=A0A1Y2G9J5_9FUNG|nr:Gcd10p family-domain-containing protein [Lobosporangium transversale]KAF9916867.1 tRNA (adenine(58)-N(1))-methyltransferase non-catalytic subunit trm6 [Lobosporangium transversale]ORY95195.1 Gcd10p family-domain-containing protein [Lobosporangium transversale]|eukprot:XP_021875395.1 Gcd10p family-domain-containing protein [Lobosporangium transversale]